MIIINKIKGFLDNGMIILFLIIFFLFLFGCQEKVEEDFMKKQSSIINNSNVSEGEDNADFLEKKIEIMKNQTFFCQRAAKENTSEKWADCYMNIAVELNDVAVCEEISESYLKLKCYKGMAFKTKNNSICDELLNDILKKRCYDDLKMLMDPCNFDPQIPVVVPDCSTPKNTLSTFLTGINTDNIDLEFACFPEDVVITNYCRELDEKIIITKKNLTEELKKKYLECSSFYYVFHNLEMGVCKMEDNIVTCCGNTIELMDGCFSSPVDEFPELFMPKCLLNNSCDMYTIVILSEIHNCDYAKERFCNKSVPYFLEYELLSQLGLKCRGLPYVLLMSKKNDEWLIDTFFAFPVT